MFLVRAIVLREVAQPSELFKGTGKLKIIKCSLYAVRVEQLLQEIVITYNSKFSETYSIHHSCGDMKLASVNSRKIRLHYAEKNRE